MPIEENSRLPEDILAWPRYLADFLKDSSPERFNAWSASGELDARITEASSWGACRGTELDWTALTAAVKHRLAGGEQFDILPLGLDLRQWREALERHFRAASPESYQLAENAGRAKANIASIVTRSISDWRQMVSAGADLQQMSSFQSSLIARSDELHRPIIELATIQAMIAPSKIDHLDSAKETKLPDFFILGPERSGTTVFGAALSTSPDIFVLNDTMVFLRWVSMAYQIAETRKVGEKHGMAASIIPDLPIDLTQPANLNHVKWLLSMLGSTYYGAGSNDAEPNKNLARFAIHGDLLDFEAVLAAAREGHSWRTVMGRIYGSLLPRRYADKRLMGEKTPANIVEHKMLRQHFPDTKFFCVVRRPDTNLASIYRRFPSNQLEHALEHYGKFCDAIMSLRASDPNTTFIRYEDFVFDPQSTMDLVSSVLGTPTWPYDGKVASYNMPEYIGTSIDTGRAANIVTMGPQERSLIERRCRRLIDAYYSQDW